MSSFPSRHSIKQNSRWVKRHSQRRLFFEPLEDRRVLATITFSGSGGSPGDFDPSFSGDGRDLAAFVGMNAWDIAFDGDGKLVVAGSIDNGSDLDFAIARFNPDGGIDSTFGENGLFTQSFPGEIGEAVAMSVAIQPDGKIVAAGFAFTSSAFDFAVLRLDSGGLLDTGFDVDGMVLTNLDGSDQGRDMAILPGGTITVVGNTSSLAGLAIARFDIDGAFLGATVQDVQDLGLFEGSLEAVTIDGSGNILAAGSALGENGPAVALIRVDPAGAFDLSFDLDGIVIDDIDGLNVWEDIQGVALQGNSIVVAGSDLGTANLLLARYNSNGSRDLTFGGNSAGFAITDLGGNEFGFDVAVDEDNKLVVAGGGDATGNDFLVVRCEANGVLDSTFVASGDFDSRGDVAHSVTMQLGKIVVAGASDTDFAVARYLSEPGGAAAPIIGFEGDSLLVPVTGTYSGIAPGQILEINWGDGTTTQLAVSGSGTFSQSHVFVDNSTSVKASIVGDPDSEIFYPAAVSIDNVAPSIDSFVGPNSGVRGQAYSFVGAFTDAGILDTHEVAWDFGNGWTIPFHPSSDAGALTPAYAYANTGSYTVSLSVRDDDGGVTTVSTVVSVVVAELQVDPSDPSKTALALGGTSGSDSIEIRPAGNGVEAFIGGVSQGVFSPTGGVLVYGGFGNDDLQVAGSISRTAWLYGGHGDDRVKGGGGNDVLLGGDGDDLLVGGQGRDLLIGGLGADRIVGNADDDILISGTTDHDADPTALARLLAEWTSTLSYLNRAANLYCGYGGDRQNGSYYLNQNTVHDDNAADVLTGSQGQDLFFGNFSLDDDATVKDKITDLHPWEFAIDIDFIESE